jgi:hyperosmotically inducible periplasmic protein
MKAHGPLLRILAVAALAFAPACRNTAEGLREDSRQNAAKAEVVRQQSQDTAEKIGEKAKEVGSEVAAVARDVGETAKDVAKAVSTDGGAAKQTIDIKAALMIDNSLDASHVDVDTDGATRTVTLRGAVPTAGQKAAVEKIAREKAEGYKVRSLLTVTTR